MADFKKGDLVVVESTPGDSAAFQKDAANGVVFVFDRYSVSDGVWIEVAPGYTSAKDWGIPGTWHVSRLNKIKAYSPVLTSKAELEALYG